MQQTGQQQRQQRYTGGKQRTHLQKDGSAHYTECGAAQLCAPGGCSLAGGAARAGDLQRQRGPKADGRICACGDSNGGKKREQRYIAAQHHDGVDRVPYGVDGAEVVYGVRSRRDTDTFFKRFTAEGFYHVMNALGADIVFNHADYRLISTRVLESFADYKEVNIFLRGMVPLVGFPHDVVTYERHERLAGESHYPLSKMLALAFDGITSLSNKPIRIITGAGIVVSLVSFIGVIWAIVCAAMGSSVAGWASTVCIVCFMSGVQLVCLGVIGEYIGKIYMETKARPRYIISERTWAPYERKYHG